MPRKGQRHRSEALGPNGMIARGTKRGLHVRRMLAKVAPSEILELERTGTVARSLRPYAALAVEEAAQLTQALGGEDQISEQRLVLVQDLSRLGLLLRALVARIAQRDVLDADEVAKVTSLVNARRASLLALGLERTARDVPDLRSYLAERANGGGSQIDAAVVPRGRARGRSPRTGRLRARDGAFLTRERRGRGRGRGRGRSPGRRPFRA